MTHPFVDNYYYRFLKALSIEVVLLRLLSIFVGPRHFVRDVAGTQFGPKGIKQRR